MTQKKHPGIGWIHGDQAISNDATLEILKLRKKVEQLEAKLEESQSEAPKGAEHLAQGEDKFKLPFTFDNTGPDNETYNWNWTVTATWNQLFSEVSPLMIHESITSQLRNRISAFAEKKCKNEIIKDKEYKGHRRLRNVVVDQSGFETIIIQLSALGLISQSVKNRSVKDRGTYWTLTPYGVTVMNRLRAVLKETG